eukprot:1146543-Pelagomonas_calceolata.AAC.6
MSDKLPRTSELAFPLQTARKTPSTFVECSRADVLRLLVDKQLNSLYAGQRICWYSVRRFPICFAVWQPRAKGAKYAAGQKVGCTTLLLDVRPCS